MNGHVGDLSATQEEALRQFRAAVAEIPNKPEEDDYYYLRWLRARKFNVKKAEEMFRKVNPNAKYHLSTIKQNPRPVNRVSARIVFEHLLVHAHTHTILAHGVS